MNIMALDIGGTFVKSAIYREGQLEEIQENVAQVKKGGKYLMEQIVCIIKKYSEQFDFERIGVSTTGQVDPIQGSIIYANENVPGYAGMPVKHLLEEEFHVPVFVENDVNAAAMGEALLGAGRGESQFVCLTYGTGVGGAIFTNGKLYYGSSFSAAEFGGILIHPEQRDAAADILSGCYERYASTTALIERAKKIDPTLINGRIIFSRLEEKAVKIAIDAWIYEVIFGLTTIIHMLNPSCVILGGGVMEQEYVIHKIQEEMQSNLIPSHKNVQIKRAELGNKAGLLGMCVVAGILTCK